MAQYLIFAILAVVIACASTYNVEYQERTDAVLLSTKFGKSRLGKAKTIAAIIIATTVYWFMALTLLIVSLIFFGMDGTELHIQVPMLMSTYNISLFAATLITCVIGYLAMLALLGIVLLLSARMKSSMGILAIGVAVVMVPLFVPNLYNNVANHILFLFPYYALNPQNLFDMVSYSLGSIVIEYPMMLTILYAILFVGGSLLATRSFAKHQVA